MTLMKIMDDSNNFLILILCENKKTKKFGFYE